MNFDSVRELEKELDETKRECKQKLEETNRRVDQTNQKVNEIEIKTNRNTEDINRLTGMIETLAINIQNHEEKMAKYDKILEKLEQSLADNKIRINKQNHWMKKYAKDAFSNKKENTNNKNINKEKDYDQGTMTRSSTKKTFPKMDKSYNKDILN